MLIWWYIAPNIKYKLDLLARSKLKIWCGKNTFFLLLFYIIFRCSILMFLYCYNFSPSLPDIDWADRVPRKDKLNKLASEMDLSYWILQCNFVFRVKYKYCTFHSRDQLHIYIQEGVANFLLLFLIFFHPRYSTNNVHELYTLQIQNYYPEKNKTYLII